MQPPVKAVQGGNEEATAAHCALCCAAKTELRICAFPLSGLLPLPSNGQPFV